jgi:hypothetical protein
MKKVTLFLLLGFLFSQCDRKEESNEDYGIAAADQKSYVPGQASGSTDASEKSIISSSLKASVEVPMVDKKVIKNANLRFQVKSHKESGQKIEKLVKDLGGYIATSSEQNSSYALQTNMTIRIMGNKFDEMVNALLKESVYTNQKNITAQDVTAQFVDTEARLKTKREVEKRYLDILKQAKNIEEILQVENQLAVIREEIEAKEGLLKLLNDQVSYSTVNIEFYESIDYLPQPEDGFFSKVYKGIKTGWDGLLSFVVGIFYIWPFIIFAGSIFYLIRRWRNNRKQKE